MGRFAIGIRALGMSLGLDVNVLMEAPGPHNMRAWNPGGGMVAWGIAWRGRYRRVSLLERRISGSQCLLMFKEQ